MSIYKEKDIKEIEERINSRICSYCGGKSTVAFTLSKDVLFTNKTVCCKSADEKMSDIINDEFKYQTSLILNRILRL